MPNSDSKSGWSFRINRKIHKSAPATTEARQLAGMFGLDGGFCETLYDDLDLEICPGQIIAVVGPSGAGKSVLLREISRRVRKKVIWLRAEALGRDGREVVSVLRGGSLARRLELLSRCGLAEATVLITKARYLSGGQLYRLALAEAIWSARASGDSRLIIADEFAASLDRMTAWMLCRQLRKIVSTSRSDRHVRETRKHNIPLSRPWPGGGGVAFLLATVREELLEPLAPDKVIVKPLGQPPYVINPKPRKSGRVERWSVREGTIKDYDALGRFHYIAGRPAAHKRVYIIRSPRWARQSPGSPDVAAVLVVSPPLANVRGRNVATAGRYSPVRYRDDSPRVSPGAARDDQRRRWIKSLACLNDEVEAISRVVVHPIYRGAGLAVKLVRHALRTAHRPVVESLAVMGRVHPFFEISGMDAWSGFHKTDRMPYVYYIYFKRGG